ncbi:MAG: DUF1501 domain-containing protein [Pirellulales bacterium]
MLELRRGALQMCDRLTRRQWLSVGSLGTLGLSLPWLLARQAAANESPAENSLQPRAKACIQIFLWGGPGQHETWDLKPDQPAAIRGDFNPIATSVPGTQICEHLPQLAGRAGQYSIIRGVTHTGVNHGTSSYHMLTGHIHAAPGTLKHPAPNDVPHTGINAARFLQRAEGLPGFVHLPSIVNDGDGLPVPGQGEGFLGGREQPFMVLGDLTAPDFRVPALALSEGLSRDRLGRRASLRRLLDDRAEYLTAEGAGQQLDGSYLRALELLQSRQTEAAFNLAAEPLRQRDRYGMHHFAQGLLLARRLVEAGVPLVTVYWNTPRNTDDQSWDTHNDQHRRMKDHLLPHFDRGLSALLDDLRERGLLDETLVTWFGEFGRTPKINGNGGREHWGFCQSAGVAGGGTRPGTVYGSSTKDGGYAASDPVSPDDLAATTYHLLGINPHTLMHDLSGRPLPLSYGQVVRGIIQ